MKIYADGASVRLHNKRIVFAEEDGKTLINFRFADENADKPACRHLCHKGRVRDTSLKVSTEAMDALMVAYVRYKRKR